MVVDAQIRQRLSRLAQDLLPAGEAAELRRQIEGDGELAQAYAEAIRTLEASGQRVRLLLSNSSPRPASRADAVTRKRWRTWANWIIGITAGVLLLVSTSGYLYHRGQLADIAAEHLRLQVTGPSRLHAKVPNTYTITTASVTGNPVAAQIEFALQPPDGKPLMPRQVQVDEDGVLEVTVPADLEVPQGTRLEVRGLFREKSEQLVAPLEVEPVRYATQLSVDRPLYGPGETVRYRSLTVSRFGLCADRDGPIRFEIVDSAGRVVDGSASSGVTSHGVGSGQFTLAERSAGGRYTLVARSLDKSFVQARRSFLVQTTRTTAVGREPPPEPEAGKVQVTFFPEGGQLAAQLENRVYFVARDARGKAVHLTGRIVDGMDRMVAPLDAAEGAGAFTFKPMAGETYRLKIESPLGHEDGPRLPEAVTGQTIALTTGAGVFAAGVPLEFNVRASEEGVPLVIAATCRGVPVGQQTLVTKLNANAVKIPLQGDFGGVVRLTVYDYRTSPPKPVAERLVYRRPAERLKVKVASDRERYAPGEKVELSFTVSDERGKSTSDAEPGKPLPAVLGVAVVDDRLLRSAGEPAAISTRLLLGGDPGTPGFLEEADFYLGEDNKAEVALDLLLATQGWRRFVEELLPASGQPAEAAAEQFEPPLMLDNLAELQARYKDSVAAYRSSRTRVLHTLITLSLFGGASLVVFVAVLSLMNVPVGLRLWIPSLAVAAACIVIGLLLMNPEGPSSRGEGTVAFASFTPAGEHGPGRAKAPATVTPASAAPGRAAIDAPLSSGAAIAAEGESAVRLAVGHGAPEERGVGTDRIDESPDQPAALPAAASEHAKKLEEPAPEGGANGAPERRVFPVRQYAYRHPSGSPQELAETLYWHPLLIADADGRAKASFELSGAVGSFRVMVDAHAAGGRLGAGAATIVSRIPFALEPKAPPEVTAGDRIDLPVDVINDTERRLPVELALEHGTLVRLTGSAKRSIELGPHERSRQYFVVEATQSKGDCELVVRGRTGQLADAARRSLRIVPPGAARQVAYAGQIDRPQEIVARLPEESVPGSLEVSLMAFPSTRASVEQGIEALAAKPRGCFEQVVSQCYVAALALECLRDHGLTDPAGRAARRASKNHPALRLVSYDDLADGPRNAESNERRRRFAATLQHGCERLTSYQDPTGGFASFTSGPGDDVLSAYGLMMLAEANGVHDVDRVLIDRTLQWLVRRSKSDDSSGRDPQAGDSAATVARETRAAYIAWVLSHFAENGIDDQIRRTAGRAGESDDPYLLALAADTLIRSARRDQGRRLLEKLAKAQAADGHLAGNGSIVRSRGPSLDAETTALAALAWLRMPDYTAHAQRAIDWLLKNRQAAGDFGSTQATVLALKAMVEHSRISRRPVAEGKLVVQCDGQLIGQRAFPAGQEETVVLDGLESKFTTGDNRLTVSVTGDNKMPYVLSIGYHSQKPTDPETPIFRLSTQLDAQRVKLGDKVSLQAELVNAADRAQPMTIAVLGLPAGLTLREGQIEKLRDAGTLDYCEVRGREVICYWRDFAPQKKVTIHLELVAATPGNYVAPPSCAYLSYGEEVKQWAEPLTVAISRD
jgi:alpha-2-macroglobulin-like protein